MSAPAHQTHRIPAPILTLPSREAIWVAKHYAGAKTILEYGSGGSTAMAAKMGGKRVFSVESDAAWMNNLQGWLNQENLSKGVTLHYADIGPTGKWGMPKSRDSWQRFPSYSLSVWDRDDFVQPDLVLVDGRFRVGCILATLLRSKKPVTLLCDDYTSRPEYYHIEKFTPRVETRGRMVRFEIEPMAIKADQLLEIYEMLTAVR